MRSRNIKPGFFKNYHLGRLPYEVRLLFEGLWCIADRLGRLKDEPMQIKAEVLPYDSLDEHQISTMLDQLQHSAFILRYETKGNRYIQITNFEKHQYPHLREQNSTIPAPYKHRASTGLAPDKHHTSTVGILNPSSLNPESIPPIVPQGGRIKILEWFEKTVAAYPKERRHGKAVAFRTYKQDVKTLEEAKEVARALDNYLASEEVKKGFVMRMSKWFSEWRDWKDDSGRSGQSVHDSNDVARPDSANAGAGEQARIADAMLSKLADSKTFPEQPAAGSEAGGNPGDEPVVV